MADERTVLADSDPLEPGTYLRGERPEAVDRHDHCVDTEPSRPTADHCLG